MKIALKELRGTLIWLTIIERNTFRRLKMNAITVGAEYEFWREAGWVEDVTIRDNTIEDVGRHS